MTSPNLSARINRIRVTGNYATFLGNVMPGTVIINESQSTSVYLGGSDVGPMNGIRLTPGNTCTWSEESLAYAVVDSDTGTDANILVTTAISYIDQMSQSADAGIVLLPTAVESDEYGTTWTADVSAYPSVIVEGIGSGGFTTKFRDPDSDYDDTRFSEDHGFGEHVATFYPVSGRQIVVTSSAENVDVRVWGLTQYVGDSVRPTWPVDTSNLIWLGSQSANGTGFHSLDVDNLSDYSGIFIRIVAINNDADNGTVMDIGGKQRRVFGEYSTYLPISSDNLSVTYTADVEMSATAYFYGLKRSGQFEPDANMELFATQTHDGTSGVGKHDFKFFQFEGLSRYPEAIVEIIVDAPNNDGWIEHTSLVQLLPGDSGSIAKNASYIAEVDYLYAYKRLRVNGDVLQISNTVAIGTDMTVTVNIYGVKQATVIRDSINGPYIEISDSLASGTTFSRNNNNLGKNGLIGRRLMINGEARSTADIDQDIQIVICDGSGKILTHVCTLRAADVYINDSVFFLGIPQTEFYLPTIYDSPDKLKYLAWGTKTAVSAKIDFTIQIYVLD